MSDTVTDKLDETDMLRLELHHSRVREAKLALDNFALTLNAKYGALHGLEISPDGSFRRTKAPQAPALTLMPDEAPGST